MKKVNWKLIGIITGIIGWIATALYALSERSSRKFWETRWKKEMEQCLDWRFLANSFRRHWIGYKEDGNSFDYDMLNSHVETCDTYTERYSQANRS